MRKPAGSFRVAVLGDAFVEARQVDAEKTFWRLLGRNLGSCIALGGKQVEVLNFGIGGYATTEELLTLRRDVLRFSPDLVLLGFFADNDVHDNSKALSLATTWRMRRPFSVFAGNKLVLERATMPSGSRQAIRALSRRQPVPAGDSACDLRGRSQVCNAHCVSPPCTS